MSSSSFNIMAGFLFFFFSIVRIAEIINILMNDVCVCVCVRMNSMNEFCLLAFDQWLNEFVQLTACVCMCLLIHDMTVVVMCNCGPSIHPRYEDWCRHLDFIHVPKERKIKKVNSWMFVSISMILNTIDLTSNFFFFVSFCFDTQFIKYGDKKRKY